MTQNNLVYRTAGTDLSAAIEALTDIVVQSGHCDLRTIERGKRADLVVVDGDPLDVRGLGERVVAVWKDGVRVDSKAAAGTLPTKSLG